MIKKMIFILFAFSILLAPYLDTVYAQEDLNEDFNGVVEEQLEDMELNDINDILSQFDNLHISFLQKDIKVLLENIITGKEQIDLGQIFSLVFSGIIVSIKDFIPTIFLIIAVVMLSSIVNGLSNSSSSVKNAVFLSCFLTLVLIVVSRFSSITNSVGNIIENLTKQMKVFFPIILTIMATLGGRASVSLYQPAVALLVNFIVELISHIVIPIFLICVVFSIVTNLSDNLKFNKIGDFFSSAFKWIIGIIISIFTSFVSLQGLVFSTIDNVSIKAAKYSIKSYVPIVGGMISDGFNLVMASSVLIKNGIGVVALICILVSIISPVIEIVILKFALLASSGIIESISDKRFSQFLYKLSKIIDMLIAIVLVIAFMYILMLALLICSANVF